MPACDAHGAPDGAALEMEHVSLDPAQFAEHRLTDEEWAQFDRDGYIC